MLVGAFTKSLIKVLVSKLKNPTSKAIKYYCAVTLKWTFQLFYILPETRYDTYDTVCDSTAQINVCREMYLDYQQQWQQRNVNFQMEA